MSASARRILFACGVLCVPKLECDSSAALGGKQKRRTSSAASSGASATCSAVGSEVTWVSPRQHVPRSRTSTLQPDELLTPDLSTTTSRERTSAGRGKSVSDRGTPGG